MFERYAEFLAGDAYGWSIALVFGRYAELLARDAYGWSIALMFERYAEVVAKHGSARASPTESSGSPCDG